MSTYSAALSCPRDELSVCGNHTENFAPAPFGLSTVIKGRNPLIDGFGLIAFASLTPILFVLAYGMIV